MGATLLLTLLLGLPAAVDDLVPAAIDALIEQPEDPIFFGLPDLADGNPIFAKAPVGSSRCIVDLDDVTGDGAGDLAVGYAPGGPGHALVARNGATGEVIWQMTPDAGGFRSLTGLSARDGRLALGVSSVHARVASRDGATGAAHWTRDLRPGGGVDPVNVLFVRFVDDLGDDPLPDLLVGTGEGLDTLYLLSGADGSTIWSVPIGDTVYAACLGPDLDGDTRPDVYATGGDTTPFLSALSSADGDTIWSVPLPGPGSALLTLQDVGGDATPDLAVGVFAEPAACLFAMDGADGSVIWTADSLTRNVTSLSPLGDIEGDGVDDFAAGSFDNAVSSVGGGNGWLLWRREVSTNNTGACLSVAAAGDLDGNGFVDVYGASMDHLAYLFDGAKGFLLMTHDTRKRGVAVAAITDGDGDGRAEFAVAGQGSLMLLAGDSGIADGPIVFIKPSGGPLSEMTLNVYAYPTKTLFVLGSLGTGSVPLPGFGGTFGLDPAAFAAIHIGTAPAAGESGYLIGPFPREMFGVPMYFQAATLFEPGKGLLSEVFVYHTDP
ncbi:MAG: outer membrane protein assembly factor BamB family protein [Planctomycetota bacterium]|jgi:hypothetical protein